jgi:hypothetical protein
MKAVKLFVWCFKELKKDQIENIEAELAFNVRQTTGQWPDCQNEIHFNNFFGQNGRLIAKEILEQVNNKLSELTTKKFLATQRRLLYC